MTPSSHFHWKSELVELSLKRMTIEFLFLHRHYTSIPPACQLHQQWHHWFHQSPLSLVVLVSISSPILTLLVTQGPGWHKCHHSIMIKHGGWWCPAKQYAPSYCLMLADSSCLIDLEQKKKWVKRDQQLATFSLKKYFLYFSKKYIFHLIQIPGSFTLFNNRALIIQWLWCYAEWRSLTCVKCGSRVIHFLRYKSSLDLLDGHFDICLSFSELFNTYSLNSYTL